MQTLNYQVDAEHRPVATVAEQFLKSSGLALTRIGSRISGPKPALEAVYRAESPCASTVAEPAGSIP